MGWEIGYDDSWRRDIGYGVPANCDHPDCAERIDRGLWHVCGGEPYGGEYGCGLFFCGKHLECDDRGEELVQLCERCVEGKSAFDPSRDIEEWSYHKATDPSWAPWRKQEGIPFLI